VGSRGLTDVAPGDERAPAPADDGGQRDGDGEQTGERRGAATDRRWLLVLLGICALGLGLRVGYVVGWQQIDEGELGGDAYYYHAAANLLGLSDGAGRPVGPGLRLGP
jgi:hypothetical protein